MINRNQMIAFLNYIGITNEQHHVQLYKYYQRCYRKSSNGKKRINPNYKNYRVSNFKRGIKILLGYEEELINTIVEYLIYSEKRKIIDCEIDKRNKVKENLKYEIVLQKRL